MWKLGIIYLSSLWKITVLTLNFIYTLTYNIIAKKINKNYLIINRVAKDYWNNMWSIKDYNLTSSDL